MMESASLIPNASEDIESTLWFKPQGSGAKNDDQYLIYFIPGNPGLISYYKIFMYTLSSLLECSLLSSISADVCGSSLPGFGTAKSETIIKSRLPAGLEDQISNTEKLIKIAITTHKALMSKTGANAQPKVILMGHSVGAYILLELLRRKREEQSRLEDVDIVGGVMLFPTVTEIGQSRNGRIMRVSVVEDHTTHRIYLIRDTNQVLLKIPFFIAIVAAIAKILTFAFSATTLATIIGLLVRIPISVASASAEFIKSPRGVEQALYMARDEMEIITKDKWTHEIWGDAEATRQTSEDSPVPLYFYFGKNVSPEETIK